MGKRTRGGNGDDRQRTQFSHGGPVTGKGTPREEIDMPSRVAAKAMGKKKFFGEKKSFGEITERAEIDE